MNCIISKSAYFTWCGIFKGLFFSSANAGAEFFHSKLFSAKMASIKISKSDSTTQRSKRQREKLNILDTGLKTCHYAMAGYSVKLSYSPWGSMELFMHHRSHPCCAGLCLWLHCSWPLGDGWSTSIHPKLTACIYQESYLFWSPTHTKSQRKICFFLIPLCCVNMPLSSLILHLLLLLAMFLSISRTIVVV